MKLKDFLNGSCRKPLAKSVLEDLENFKYDEHVSEPDEPISNNEETESKIPLAKRKAKKNIAKKEKEEEKEKNLKKILDAQDKILERQKRIKSLKEKIEKEEKKNQEDQEYISKKLRDMII